MEHVPVEIKYTKWLVCNRCGLVYLNNELSRVAIKHGCDYKEHSAYKEIEKRLLKREKNYKL